MKTFNIKSTILSFIALFFVATVAQAQYDDIYYSASDEAHFTTEVEEEYVPEARNDYGYSSFAEDDGYYYTSRIRRFSRPSASINYFSPVYTNAFTYGGYSPYGFNNSIGFSNGFGVTRGGFISNNAYAYNSFGSPFNSRFNTFNSFGRTNFVGGGGGFSSAYYCPPVGGGFATNRAAAVVPTNTRNVSNVTSARRSGSVSGSTPRTTTRTTRTARDFRGSSTNSSTIRRTSPRTSTRTSSRNLGSSRSSSIRSSSARSSSPSRSSSSRSSSSSRGSRG